MKMLPAALAIIIEASAISRSWEWLSVQHAVNCSAVQHAP
jgi:hypothetical protein